MPDLLHLRGGGLSKKVYLGKNDSASNYTEITDAEAEQILLARTT